MQALQNSSFKDAVSGDGDNEISAVDAFNKVIFNKVVIVQLIFF